MKRTRRFIIVVNNYKPTDRDTIKALECVSYGILGYEVGEKKKTPHIQGYLELKVKKTISAFQKILQKKGIKCAIQIAKGNLKSQDYCKKDGDYIEFGEPMKQGKRNDIHTMMELVKNGISDVALQEQFPVAYSKYYKAVDRVRRNYKAQKAKEQMCKKYSNVELRDWQKYIRESVLNQEDRKIDWVVDLEGNKGKTFLAQFMVAYDRAFYVRGGKSADIKFAYDYEPIVIFDFTRCQRERIQYDLIEEFLDGMIFSPKYESVYKYKDDIKVLCLSNFEPCQNDTLSLDRFKIHRFN